MASSISDRLPEDHSQSTECPSCACGIGLTRGVRFDGPIKLLAYECQTCHHRWEGAERWADNPITGRSTEPQMIRED
jgi:hypothetical protein